MFFLLLLFFLPLPLPAFSQESAESQPVAVKPSYDSMMLWNSLLPGLAQIELGQYGEGAAYIASSLVLNIASFGMLLYYFYLNPDSFNFGPYSYGGKTYLVPPQPNEAQMQNQWLLYGGLTLSIYASLISAYSSYSARRDYMDRYDPKNPIKGKEDIWELMLAPYNPDNLLSWDFFPVFPMTVALQIGGNDFQAISSFFQKETVDFFGYRVAPLTGLLLNTAFTFVLVSANATWEELFFRGVELEEKGSISTSISFGAAHLGNMLMPGASVEDTVMQAIDATLLGFYLSYVTEKNSHKLGKAIAIHFWHNILSFMLDYMITRGNDEVSTFDITLKVGY